MQPNITWETDEYRHQHKTPDWFWALGIVIIAAAAASVLLGNLLFAILLVIAGFTVALFAARPPERIEVELSQKGIRLGRQMYPHKNLESFWVTTETEPPLLLIERRKSILPDISIPIEDVSPDDVRLFLNNYLREEEHEPGDFIEHLMERVGF